MDVYDVHFPVVVHVNAVIDALRQEVEVFLVDPSVFFIIESPGLVLAGQVQFLYVYRLEAIAYSRVVYLDYALHYGDVIGVAFAVIVYVHGILERSSKDRPVVHVHETVVVKVCPLQDLIVYLEHLEYGYYLIQVSVICHAVAVDVQLLVQVKVLLEHYPVQVVHGRVLCNIGRRPFFFGNRVPVEVYDVLYELFVQVVDHAVVIDVDVLSQEFLRRFHVDIGYQAVRVVIDAAVGVAPGYVALFQAVHLVYRDHDPFQYVYVVPVYPVVVRRADGRQGVAHVQFIELLVGYAAFAPDELVVRVRVVILYPLFQVVPVVQVYAPAFIEVYLLFAKIHVVYHLDVQRAYCPGRVNVISVHQPEFAYLDA